MHELEKRLLTMEATLLAQKYHIATLRALLADLSPVPKHQFEEVYQRTVSKHLNTHLATIADKDPTLASQLRAILHEHLDPIGK